MVVSVNEHLFHFYNTIKVFKSPFKIWGDFLLFYVSSSRPPVLEDPWWAWTPLALLLLTVSKLDFGATDSADWRCPSSRAAFARSATVLF